jgi:mannosyltransferase OCH1-like enzyme
VISKILIQTAANKDRLHPVLADNVARLRALNPDWDYRLYDDEDCREFVSDYYGGEVLHLYDRISRRYGAAKADFFRYLALYRLGGVYLDIKSTALIPLSEVVAAGSEYLLSFWDSGSGGRDEGAGKHAKYGVPDEFQQWFIVSPRAHPFLEAVIARVSENIRSYDPLRSGVGASGVLRTTGPIAYTLAIQPILQDHSHRFVDVFELGFRYSCFANDDNKDFHRKVIPSYREVRFPVIEREPAAPIMLRARYGLAILIAYLHELSKVGGIRSRLTRMKKEMRRRRRKKTV